MILLPGKCSFITIPLHAKKEQKKNGLYGWKDFLSIMKIKKQNLLNNLTVFTEKPGSYLLHQSVLIFQCSNSVMFLV